MERLLTNLDEMRELLDEIRSYQGYRAELVNSFTSLERSYQDAAIGYQDYVKGKNRLLGNKEYSEAIEFYDSYIGSLLKKADSLNHLALMAIYNDVSYEQLHINTKKMRLKLLKKLPVVENLDLPVPAPSAEPISGELLRPDLIEDPQVPVPDGMPQDLSHREERILESEMAVPVPGHTVMPTLPKPKKLGVIKRAVYAFQAVGKPLYDRLSRSDNILFSSILSRRLLAYIFGGKSEDEFISKETKMLPSIFNYEDQRLDNLLEDDVKAVLDPYLLEKEVKEIKNLIALKETKVYQPSSLGYYANRTGRKISSYFIEQFPGVFKSLYKALRFSNIRILSNTYINIMFLLTILVAVGSLPLLMMFFAFQGSSILLVMLKSILFSMLLSVGTFGMMFYYPFMQIKNRRRSINTNLPFAIDHMSSVISSGVPPTTMFKLLSASKEYGEISIEMEKISNYLEVFGYDVLTAIRAVSATTPSPQLKDFFDSFVSTVESGGDLKNFLDQQSKEALMQYRLERQKYIESRATYSDIYTGVLIGAPRFCVVALSLVSMLGGKVGGMDVSVIITVGTYLVIPGLNLLFIIFLEMNQPDI